MLRRHAVDASRRATPADGPGEDEDDGASRIFFEPSLYHCLENCGSVLLSVTCQGGEGNSTFYVDYRTEDGSAKAGSDYEYRWVSWRLVGRESWRSAGHRLRRPAASRLLRLLAASGAHPYFAMGGLAGFIHS